MTEQQAVQTVVVQQKSGRSFAGWCIFVLLFNVFIVVPSCTCVSFIWGIGETNRIMEKYGNAEPQDPAPASAVDPG